MPHTPRDHNVDMPRANYPDRPYDQEAPYDWALEGLFEGPDVAADQPQSPDRRQSLWDKLADRPRLLGSLLLVTAALAVSAVSVVESESGSDSAPVVREIPPHLPEAVADEIDSAVKVNEAGDDGMYYGSGVKIGPDLVLTAGHIAGSSDLSRRPGCSAYVSTAEQLSQYRYGSATDVVLARTASRMDNHNDTVGQDIGLLRVEPSDVFDSLPVPRVAEDSPSVGAAVFFVNYEGGPNDGVKHVPDQDLDLPQPYVDGTGTYYDHPAEYAGTVINDQGPYLEIATSVQGYGPRPGMEINSYPGSSGGPVFDTAGNLIGESVASYDRLGSADEIASDYGVRLPGPHLRQVTIVQPITRDILKPYREARLQAVCDYDPGY